jgi:Xaa-Pro aminopeptidase
MFNFQKRLTQLQRKLATGDQPVNFLVSNLTNIYYLTGFTGSAGNLLITPDHTTLLTDGRYTTQVQQECSGIEIEIQRQGETLLESLGRVVKKSKLCDLAFEADATSKATFDALESKLPQVNLVGSSGIIESLRMIKDKNEIAAIRKSIGINERTFNVIRSQMTGEQTEREIGFNLEHQMRQFGASGCSFEPIVAVGPNAALPHATPGATRISENPVLLIDWGAQVDHYASDLTRALWVNSGKASKISARFSKVYTTVLAAQLAAIEAIRPGAISSEVDGIARKIIEEAGFGKKFTHSLGHGIGLDVHEAPGLRSNQEIQLQPGMVVTVEPGIYIPDWGGVRIEDDILVTSDGCEVLSELPKQLDTCIVSV